MKLSKRDKFLIEEAFKAGDSQYYVNHVAWLNDRIDVAGTTVEDYVAYSANKVDESPEVTGE